MKFVFAPDSFKGTLSAAQICDILEEAARRHYGNGVQIQRVPLADGGEGTVDALLLACGGEKRFVRVQGPYGEETEAGYGVLADAQGGAAVMEMAAASGIAITRRREPMEASSAGTGELLAHILDSGVRRVLVGIGGSATNDGGAGFLHALGARFFDAQGKAIVPKGGNLEQIARAELSGLHPGLAGAQIEVICDVTNPLCGPEGATTIYGPQKGANARTIPLLEAGLRSFAAVLQRALGRDISSFPGAGAAGGVGMALGGVLGARMRSGVDAVLEYAGFDRMLAGANLCITGEGRLDGQSVRYGKAISGVAQRCAQNGVPLAVIAGGLGEGAHGIYAICPCALMVTPDSPMPLEQALDNADRLMRDAADRLMRTLRLGAQVGL